MNDYRVTLNVQEVCRALGISRGLCYEMLRSGRLPCIRLGKRFLVPKKALEKMLEDCGDSKKSPRVADV